MRNVLEHFTIQYLNKENVRVVSYHFLIMFDWFDEPIVYYRRFAPMRSGVFDYMSRWMDSVDRAMERQFGRFFDPFFDPQEQKKAIEDKEEKKEEVKKEEPKKEEKKEEPKKHHEEAKKEEKEEDAKIGTQYYTFSSSMYTGSDGVQHMYREEMDSKTGNRKVVETRRIGDKSMTLQRVTDKDGKVEERETRKNINDDEVEQFKKDWISRNVPEKKSLPEPKKEEPKKEEEQKKE